MIKFFSLPPPPSARIVPVNLPPLPRCFSSSWHADRSPPRPLGARDLACFFASFHLGFLTYSAPERQPRSLTVADLAARSCSRVSWRSPGTRKPAASGSLAANNHTRQKRTGSRGNYRENFYRTGTGWSFRIGNTSPCTWSRNKDRGFWKLPIYPKTGRAPSASPGGNRGAHRNRHRAQHRARARLRPLRRSQAGYRAPGEKLGALRTGTSPQHSRSGTGPPAKRKP